MSDHTRNRDSNPELVRYHFQGARVTTIEAGLAATRAANAGRVQCPHCPLMIAPAGLSRHVSLCHEDNDE